MNKNKIVVRSIVIKPELDLSVRSELGTHRVRFLEKTQLHFK